MNTSTSVLKPARINLALRVRVGQSGWRDGRPVNILHGEVINPQSLSGRNICVWLSAEHAREESLTALQQEDRLVLLQNCSKRAQQEDGEEVWEAPDFTWIDSESSDVAVVSCFARVGVKPLRGRDIYYCDLLMPSEARILRSGDDLYKFASQYMAQSVGGVENNSNCVLRLISTSDQEVMTCWLYAARQEIQRTTSTGVKSIPVPAPLSETWREAFVDGKQSSGYSRVVAAALGVEVGKMSEEHVSLAASLKRDLAAGEILVEAIPGQRVRAVPAAMHGRESTIVDSARVCRVGNEFSFVPMTVVLQIGGARQGGMMSAVLYQAVPDVGYRRFSAKAIPTANFP